MLSIPHTCLLASRVVMFLNMASPEDLLEDDFYNELFEDVQQECLAFGSIQKVEIARPDRVGGSYCRRTESAAVPLGRCSSSSTTCGLPNRLGTR